MENNVLIIDESKTAWETIKRGLSLIGDHFRIQNVISGLEALKVLDECIALGGLNQPDLIIMELNLPGISGMEILNVLKKSSSLCDIPVIVNTSSQRLEHMCQVKKYPDVQFIKKGASHPQTLRRAVLDAFSARCLSMAA